MDTLSCICSKGFYNISNNCSVCPTNSSYNGSVCVCNIGYEQTKNGCSRLKIAFGTGTPVHQSGRIIIPVQLNYIPQTFLNNNCAACFLILSVTRKQGTQSFSTSFSYSSTPQYVLMVYLAFSSEPIQPFTVSITINPAIHQYFDPYDVTATVNLPIDPSKLPLRP
jgi:hypothetical protein